MSAFNHPRPTPSEDVFEDLKLNHPLVKQRERTVDNVKRLYAIVFSLSLANFAREIFETAKDRLNHDAPVGWALTTQFLMLLIFYLTAAVFFFHSDRFLDIRYTMPVPGTYKETDQRASVVVWRHYRFAFDYLALIFTMFPFMFLSFTMDPVVVNKYGITPFFMLYIILLLLSGVLLLPYSDLRIFSTASTAVTVPGSETGRHAALSTHWLILNSCTVFPLWFLFWVYKRGDALFQLDLSSNNAKFIVTFSIIAIIRNALDFRTVWPFLYLSRMEAKSEDRWGILYWLLDENLTMKRHWPKKLAATAFLLSILTTAVSVFWLVEGENPRTVNPCIAESGLSP